MNNRTVIIPLEADFAFPNSLKGQRGCVRPDEMYTPTVTERYTRLVKSYFFWNDLERTAADDVDYIRMVSDVRFAGCREQNVRYIPRIAILWPNHGDTHQVTQVRTEFASDMSPSTLDTPEFLARVRNLIEKIGEAWDNDPRIAYMEMGIYGLWGEQHEDFMSPTAQRVMGEAFNKAFKNTRCMVRYPRDCVGYGFGTYWDSFAHVDEHYLAVDTIDFMDWHVGVMGGEVAHNWGNHLIQPGVDMSDTLTNPKHFQHFLDTVYWQHNNHLGMRIKTDDRMDTALENLAEYQKRAGHRFVVEQVEYALSGSRLDVAAAIKNVGASPLYYDWPLTVALLDEGRSPVWQARFDNVKLSQWFPGDDWRFDKNAYHVPAKTYTADGSFILPELPSGKYTLALAILDPSCGKPNVLLATRQYFKGGWHPIGYLGLGTVVDTSTIPPELFDDMNADTSIIY